MATIGETLNALRGRSGLTLGELAEAADYRGRSSVQKFFAASYDPAFLDMSVARRLARAFVGRGKPPIEAHEILSLTGSKSSDALAYEYIKLDDLKRDVPMYYAAFAILKSFNSSNIEVPLFYIATDNLLEYIWHPPALSDRRGFFAILLQGGPLAPRYRPGERLIVDVALPPRLGDDVCISLVVPGWKEVKVEEISLGDNLYAFGILEEQNFKGVTIRMMSSDERVSFSSNEVRSIQRILTATDILVP